MSNAPSVAARENPECLDHDSFVELRGIIEHDPSEIEEALGRNEARLLGRLSISTVIALIQAVQAAPTLTSAEINAIATALAVEYGIVA